MYIVSFDPDFFPIKKSYFLHPCAPMGGMNIYKLITLVN